MGYATAHRRVRHLSADQVITRPETLAVEEPLEIRVNGTPVTVTMRTPGSDFELVQGFLLAEGVVAHREDVLTVSYCGRRVEGNATGASTYNVLDVALAPGVKPPDVDVTRTFYTTSSCGVCGKASLQAVSQVSRFAPGGDPATVAADTLKAMPDQLRRAQRFSREPVGCTLRHYSGWTAPCLPCVRISAGTMRSTRSSAGLSSVTEYRLAPRCCWSAGGRRSS